jgi:uncharacterized protein (DUF2147 family)
MKNLLLLLTGIFLFNQVQANDDADAIVGVWQNGSAKGHILIYKQKGKYYGKIIWLHNPNDIHGKPKTDKNNPNEALRSDLILGKVVLRDFVFDKKDNEWNEGRIYNPDDGKEYKSFMKLKDKNTLYVKGYVGFTWLGKADTWKRIK